MTLGLKAYCRSVYRDVGTDSRELQPTVPRMANIPTIEPYGLAMGQLAIFSILSAIAISLRTLVRFQHTVFGSDGAPMVVGYVSTQLTL